MVALDLGLMFSVGGIFGFILKEILDHVFGGLRVRRDYRIAEETKAASKLKQAFFPVYFALDPAQYALKEDLSTFLARPYKVQREAVIEYSFFLDKKERADFMQAWYEYCCHPQAQNERGIPFFEQYSCRGLTIEQQHAKKALAKARIEKILKFTER